MIIFATEVGCKVKSHVNLFYAKIVLWMVLLIGLLSIMICNLWIFAKGIGY